MWPQKRHLNTDERAVTEHFDFSCMKTRENKNKQMKKTPDPRKQVVNTLCVKLADLLCKNRKLVHSLHTHTHAHGFLRHKSTCLMLPSCGWNFSEFQQMSGWWKEQTKVEYWLPFHPGRCYRCGDGLSFSSYAEPPCHSLSAAPRLSYTHMEETHVKRKLPWDAWCKRIPCL